MNTAAPADTGGRGTARTAAPHTARGRVGGRRVTDGGAGSVTGMSTAPRRPLTVRPAIDTEDLGDVVGARRLPVEQLGEAQRGAPVDGEDQAVVEPVRARRRPLRYGPPRADGRT